MNKGRYSQEEIENLTKQALTAGFCILRNHFDADKVRNWHKQFQPLLEEHIEREGHV